MYFPVADIELNPLIPLLTGLAVSAICAPAGVSGGFLILPIHLNFLGFTSLAVSPTNFIFNIISMPLGLWRLHREKRVMWGLGLIIMLGCLPGIFAGTVLRCTWLRRASDFKLFVALVLAALALNMVYGMRPGDSRAKKAEKLFIRDGSSGLACTYRRASVVYEFGGERFSFPTASIVLVSLLVGLLGGIYGIGGAAIIAPVLIGSFKMPVYLVSGASLMAGWAGAIFGLFSYIFFWPLISGESPIIPDFMLGLLFGLGGMAGVYLGAAVSGRLPAWLIKTLLLGLIVVMIFQNIGLI